MQVQNRATVSSTPSRPAPSAAPAAETPAAPSDSVTITQDPPKPKPKGDLATILRRGVKGAAFFGLPAAMAAAGKAHSPTGYFLGAAGGQVYGAVHGGKMGWDVTPGKYAGGFMLSFITVPMGAFAGTISAAVTGAIGAAAGVPGVVGCAAAGFALGAYHGYSDPNPDQW